MAAPAGQLVPASAHSVALLLQHVLADACAIDCVTALPEQAQLAAVYHAASCCLSLSFRN